MARRFFLVMNCLVGLGWVGWMRRRGVGPLQTQQLMHAGVVLLAAPSRRQRAPDQSHPSTPARTMAAGTRESLSFAWASAASSCVPMKGRAMMGVGQSFSQLSKDTPAAVIRCRPCHRSASVALSRSIDRPTLLARIRSTTCPFDPSIRCGSVQPSCLASSLGATHAFRGGHERVARRW